MYRSYEEAVTFLDHLAESYPDLVRVESIGTSWEQREIKLITLSLDISSADDKPALFYTGTIHAREWIGVELALDFAKYVVENISFDPWVKELLRYSTVYMVPCVNPDGLEYSRNYFSFWRKNRRQNADGSYGVDLNRNFPVGFSKSNKTYSEIYPGPQPFSEPETQALRDFIAGHPNISIALDYHSQGNVFFPAHDFRHEDTIDTTDMNVLCANMAESIRKVSNREYGIHQGKPPTSLISGSGREFYHSHGILASVVEVGTRNISDYLDDMSEHIKEQIHALLTAINEVPNYAKDNPLPRVTGLTIETVSSFAVSFSWQYETERAVYFEIYRNTRPKRFCTRANRVGITKICAFSDDNLQSTTEYYYYIRAVDKETKVKSAFAPLLRVKTLLNDDELSRIYYPTAAQTGYVAERLENNRDHFGQNSLYVGVDEVKGISYAILNFSLATIPKNAIIKSAVLSLYPINRVSTTIEKYGEWNIAMVDPDSIEDMAEFDQVDQVDILHYVGRPTTSDHLTQGIWRNWKFSQFECRTLQEQIVQERTCFRVEGPKELKAGRSKQMMQWDIGYGRDGSGLNYRPKLEIVYTIEPVRVELYPKTILSLSHQQVLEDEFICGCDVNGKKVYSVLEFDISSLPAYDYSVIVSANLWLNATKVYFKENLRFHLEFIEETPREYGVIHERIVIENIGYDVSSQGLKSKNGQQFYFDKYSLLELAHRQKQKRNVTLLLRPTSSEHVIKDKLVEWCSKESNLAPRLVIEYLPKRRNPVAPINGLRHSIDNGRIRLDWNNPDDVDFRGVKVVKNNFRPPLSPFDGVKIYAGSDNYTYDSFGALDLCKYFAVFTYDDVPNYSKPVIVKYCDQRKINRK